MKLRRIKITHLPGISRSLALDGFGPGINVITGPNASGKSSLIRALRHLIDEVPEPGGGALTLEAELASDGKLWTATRSGSDVIWQQAGHRVERPSLPRGDFLQCYWLSMDDLLEEGETDQEIAAELRRALSGGFDVEAIRSDPRFLVSPYHGRSEQNQLREREKTLHRVLRNYEQLERERQRIPLLESEIAESAAAATRAERAERALEWLDIRQQRVALEARLEEFPPGMDRFDGQESRRLQAFENRRQELRTEVAETQEKKADAETRLAESDLKDDPPDRPHLEICRNDLEAGREAWKEMKYLREQHAEERAAETTAATALNPEAKRLPEIRPGAVDQAVDLAEQLRQVERRVLELEALPKIDPVDAEILSALEALANELRRWLRHVDPGRFRKLFGAGIGSLGFAVAAALTASGGGALTAAVLAGLATMAGIWMLAQVIALGNGRTTAEARAAELPLPPPASWTADEVAKRLREVEDEKANRQYQNERAREVALRREELEPLRTELEELREKQELLSKQIGFGAAKTAEGVVRFMTLVTELDRSRTKVRGIENKFGERSKILKSCLARLAEYLLRYRARTDSDAMDLDTMRVQLESLERRSQSFREAARALSEADQALHKIERELGAVDAQIEEVYRDAGVTAGDRQTLVERCERVEAYRQLRNDRDKAKIREQERRSRVADDEDLVAVVESGDESGLRQRLTELQTQAQSLEEQRDELADLNVRLKHAGRDRALETAQLERDDARDALDKAYEHAMRGDAAFFLLDDVLEEHRMDQELAVLAAARERFARYTNDRYSLQVDDDGRVLAWDNQHETKHIPGTLSTGTRMQLLLAMRLAWTSVMERESEPLPIFLDEALTTSDPHRFRSIARNLQDTAERENRQILYLSSEPADLVRWARAIGERPTHIDLALGVSGDSPLDVEDYLLVEPEPTPAPEGSTPEEYAARLGVPQVDPRKGAGEIYLFHLLRDDLDLVFSLLNDWRVTQLGPLEQLLESKAGENAVPNAATRERLVARCRITRVWVEAWTRGRGRPLDRNALEASGAVSDRFLDELTELAERLKGDAKRVLEALDNRQVANFHRSKINELEVWLEEEGYLDSREALNREDREYRTLLACADVAAPSEIQGVVHSLESSTASSESAVAERSNEERPSLVEQNPVY